ncbi:alpha/beta hydrolase [Spongiactinospora gelatinilytica]|uniref:Alpha/beta hydrolase n=1 Tax=Spongiactinospora gelatinilytica TaxID=2666298 RepID=A0A2W2F1D6_9ACTN|nr:alpha/beta hydrolase [Spongiactinospora gelatinilytica]
MTYAEGRTRTGGSALKAIRRIGMAVAGLGMALALAVPAGATAPSGGDPITLPAPTGPHPVGWEELHLVDRGRPDPWAPPAPRELMVSVWYPAAVARGAAVPYATAEESRLLLDLMEQAGDLPPDTLTRVRTHARAGAPPLRTRHRLPLVVLSPGLTDPRWMLTSLAEDLASRGYMVAGVDHPYEAAAVTFPDGRVATCRVCAGGDQGEKVVAGRVRDISFVLDRLKGHGRYGKMIDHGRVAAVGHSIGGAAAAATMAADRRVDAGINLDGSFRPPLARDLARPFLMLAADAHGKHGDNWNDTWAHLTGWRRWLQVPGMAHRSPSDVPIIAEALGLQVQKLPGARCVKIVREYVAAFADRHLRHRNRPLLNGPSPRFPEVRFVGPTSSTD